MARGMLGWSGNFFFLLLTLSQQTFGFLNTNVPPSFFQNTSEIIKAAGYPAQQYDVVTRDGYILRVFRIADGQSTKKKPPILLMHGMTVAFDSWVMQGPGKDLVYMLYDAGYDVWMGDVRGNAYSRRHVSLSTNDPAFWRYSYHEMGTEDVPALIDYILKKTGKKKLSYIGHSMGSASFFVLGSEKPEYMEKIRVFIAFAPVTALNFTNFPEEKKILVRFARKVLNSFKEQETYELLPRVFYGPLLSNMFCGEMSPTQNLCYDILFFWAGAQSKRMSQKVLPQIMSHVPAGLSLSTPDHFLQTIEAGRFQQMDFGLEENMRRYGSEVPPEYNITRVTVPVALHYSSGDYLVNASDVQATMSKLPNIIYAKDHKEYNHIDYVWGRSAWREVYPDVLKVLAKYNSPIR